MLRNHQQRLAEAQYLITLSKSVFSTMNELVNYPSSSKLLYVENSIKRLKESTEQYEHRHMPEIRKEINALR
jgi:hypothetical protein